MLDADGLGVLEHDQPIDAEVAAKAPAQFIVGHPRVRTPLQKTKRSYFLGFGPPTTACS